PSHHGAFAAERSPWNGSLPSSNSPAATLEQRACQQSCAVLPRPPPEKAQARREGRAASRPSPSRVVPEPVKLLTRAAKCCRSARPPWQRCQARGAFTPPRNALAARARAPRKAAAARPSSSEEAGVPQERVGRRRAAAELLEDLERMT